MRCFSCSKLGSFFKGRASRRLSRRVLALCCLLAFLASSSALLLSDFFTCSVSAQESNLGVWSAWDYRLFNTYTRWDDLANDRHFEWNHTGNENTATYDASNDVTSVGYGNLLGVNAVAATNLFQVRVTPMSNPVSTGSFHILQDYVGQTATVPVTLNITTSPASIAAISPSYYAFRLYLDDGTYIAGAYQTESRTVSAYSSRLTVTFKFDFPASSAGKDIVYFDLYYNINMTFNQDGGPGDIGINFSYSIPDFTLSPSDAVVDAAAAVQAGTGAALDSFASGVVDSLVDDESMAIITGGETSLHNLYDRVSDLFRHDNVFGLSMTDFYPARLIASFESIRFMINYIVNARSWLKLLLSWSLALGGLSFILSITGKLFRKE